MGDKSRGPGPPWITFPLIHQLLIVTILWTAAAEKNKFYTMDALCKETTARPTYHKVDGASIKSQNEKQLECAVTFQTHTVLQRFLLRFDLLSLDCNDHLFIYDGSHVGEYKHDLSCANTKTSVGVITTRTNFVTLKYVTDSWGTDSNGFELVITAVKDSAHQCKDFNCQLSPFCVNPDLVCDGVAHCNDGSDEDPAMCSQYDPNNLILGLNLPLLVTLFVSLALVTAACVVGAILLYRTYPAQQHTPSRSTPAHSMYTGANGMSKGLPMSGAPTVSVTAPCTGTTVLGPMTVNWAHPAALGYLVVLLRLYSQAE